MATRQNLITTIFSKMFFFQIWNHSITPHNVSKPHTNPKLIRNDFKTTHIIS